jgi:hypothetical protein
LSLNVRHLAVGIVMKLAEELVTEVGLKLRR